MNHYNVKKIESVDLNADSFEYLKWIDFLLIQLFADVLSADIDDIKLNLVFFLKNYEFIILIVVVNLTELNLNDAVIDKIIKINHFLDVQYNYWDNKRYFLFFKLNDQLWMSIIVNIEECYLNDDILKNVVCKLH